MELYNSIRILFFIDLFKIPINITKKLFSPAGNSKNFKDLKWTNFFDLVAKCEIVTPVSTTITYNDSIIVEIFTVIIHLFITIFLFVSIFLNCCLFVNIQLDAVAESVKLKTTVYNY